MILPVSRLRRVPGTPDAMVHGLGSDSGSCSNGVISHRDLPRPALVVGFRDQQWRQVPSPS